VIGIGDIVRLGLPVAQIAVRLLTPSRATSAASKSSAGRLRRVRIGAMHLTDKMTWIADSGPCAGRSAAGIMRAVGGNSGHWSWFRALYQLV
jgi:hypothetical protein